MIGNSNNEKINPRDSLEERLWEMTKRAQRAEQQLAAMRREMEWATGEMRGRCPDHWKVAMQSDAGRDLISGKLLMPLIETLKYYANISPVAGGKSRAQVALDHAKSIGIIP